MFYSQVFDQLTGLVNVQTYPCHSAFPYPARGILYHCSDVLTALFWSLVGKFKCPRKVYIEFVKNLGDPTSTAKSFTLLPFSDSWHSYSANVFVCCSFTLVSKGTPVLGGYISWASGSAGRCVFAMFPLLQRGSPSDWEDQPLSPNHWHFSEGHFVEHCFQFWWQSWHFLFATLLSIPDIAFYKRYS